MPFELTHIVVAQQVLKQLQKPLTPQLLGGVIYPDVRYPAKIDRRLTHTMNGFTHFDTDDFSFGVKPHLETDRAWDEVMLSGKTMDGETIGGLKLVHETVMDNMLDDKAKLIHILGDSLLPSNLPISDPVWQDWKQAIATYVADGANGAGWKKIILTMGFMNEVDLSPRLEMVEKMMPKYISEIEEKHQLIVDRLFDIMSS